MAGKPPSASKTPEANPGLKLTQAQALLGLITNTSTPGWGQPIGIDPGQGIYLQGDPGLSTTFDVTFVNGQKESWILRAGRNFWWPPGYLSRIAVTGGSTANLVGIFTTDKITIETIHRLNANADTVVAVAASGQSGVLTIPPPTGGTSPSPIIVPLDAIAETDVSVPSGEVWEIEGIHAHGTAALVGTVTLWVDAGKTMSTFSRSLPANDNSDVLPSANPIHLTGPAVIAVNVTVAGTANSRLTISYRRIA